MVERHETEGIYAYLIEDREAQQQLVSELDIDPHIQLRSPRDRLLNNQLDKLIDFQLRYATLQQQAQCSGSEVRGLLAPEPHCYPIRYTSRRRWEPELHPVCSWPTR